MREFWDYLQKKNVNMNDQEIYKPHMHMTELCDWNQINRKVSVSTSPDRINKTD